MYLEMIFITTPQADKEWEMSEPGLTCTYLLDFGVFLWVLVSCLFEGRFAGPNHTLHIGVYYFLA